MFVSALKKTWVHEYWGVKAQWSAVWLLYISILSSKTLRCPLLGEKVEHD